VNAQGAQWDCRCIHVSAQGHQWDCTVSDSEMDQDPVGLRWCMCMCTSEGCRRAWLRVRPSIFNHEFV